MKLSLLSLPMLAFLTAPAAWSCGPFFKAMLFSAGNNNSIVLAAPVADVLAEILTAPGAPSLPLDEGVARSGKEVELPEGLTVSGEGLSSDAWSVLRHDLVDLNEALGNSEGRPALLVAYAQGRRANLLTMMAEIGRVPAAGGAMPNWPKGLPVEFQTYAEGAALYQQGRLPEAQAAWEKVLALPAEQRRYRGTWAAWMLGRTCYKTDPAAAVRWFQRIRQEARVGKDSLDRAAVSLGWEALAEEARLASDPGGFSVARAERVIWLLASHAKAGGGEPIFLAGRHYATNQELPVRRAAQLMQGWMRDDTKVKAAAASPWLRAVMTSSLLPIHRAAPPARDAAGAAAEGNPAGRWFAALEAVHPGGSEDLADRLAWAAYQAGAYQRSASWLKRARESPMTHWLMAKQALQAGKMVEAAQHLEAARPGFDIAQPQADRHEDYEGAAEEATALQREQFQADLGLVRLAVDDFPGSLDALCRSGFWEDAAYVLENVVTAAEAVKYAEKWPLDAGSKATDAVLPVPLTVPGLMGWVREHRQMAEVPAQAAAMEQKYGALGMLHGAVARRLAREGDTRGSREFQTAWLRPVLDLFLKQRATGQNKALPKAQRAAGFWKAALLHRYCGMELGGFEGFPDNAYKGGAFTAEHLTELRLGLRRPPEAVDPQVKPVPVFPPVSGAERARLKAQAPRPAFRFHYRYQAYALAKQGFDLLPDNSEELSVMLNLAGWWFVPHDEAAARRSLAELIRRCPQTTLGRRAKAKDWLVVMEPALEESVKKLN